MPDLAVASNSHQLVRSHLRTQVGKFSLSHTVGRKYLCPELQSIPARYRGHPWKTRKAPFRWLEWGQVGSRSAHVGSRRSLRGWRVSAQEMMRSLATPEVGLSALGAARRLRQAGPNSVRARKRASAQADTAHQLPDRLSRADHCHRQRRPGDDGEAADGTSTISAASCSTSGS
jgi:hypothetical protein